MKKSRFSLFTGRHAAQLTHCRLPDDFTVTAHAGSLGTKDNSLESLQVGLDNADIIEFDLQFTEDGAPVLSHNSPKPDAVPLQDAFALLAKYPQKKANIDIKSTANLPEIERLAQEYGVLDQIFLTGVGEDFVAAVQRDCKQIPYYLNYNPKKHKTNAAYLQSLVDKVKACGAIGINSNLRGGSVQLSKAFHDAGLLVSLWTANSAKDIRKTVHSEPDNVTSRIPDQVRAYVEEHAVRND